jgi:hypothetical protein
MRMFRTVLEQKIWERRETLEEFAEYAEMFAREHHEPGTLGVRHLQRLAAGRGPKGQPLGPVKPATARLLESIFNVSVDDLLSAPGASREAGTSETRSHFGGAFEWLDEYAGWSPGSTEHRVTALSGGAGLARDRQARRGRVGRMQLVGALAEYYAEPVAGHGFYGVRCGSRNIVTSIVTRPDWIDLACSLGEGDQLALAPPILSSRETRDEVSMVAAVQRLAEMADLGVRMADVPLYRLVELDARPEKITGEVTLARFVEYALTMDLLESELVDATISASSALPLRDRYLPDLASVLDVSNRLCAGGVLALCAIARPADPYRGPADYALLVQERSGRVLNVTGRLAVIPKGFHQPMSDVRADAQIGVTLRRELEEELFGRGDLDSTAGVRRAAVPMHPSRYSEPMRWLTEQSGRLRMECTGFGLNLVSGNYEFASVVVIEDDEFWTRYGGQIEANWESLGLRLYSSLDRELLSELVADESWSNEGLFALCQGLRRLAQLGGDRVNVPVMEATATER